MRLSITAQPGELEHKAFDLVRSLVTQLQGADPRLGVAAELLAQLANDPAALRRAALQEGALYMPEMPGGGLQGTHGGVRFTVAPEQEDGSVSTDDSGARFTASETQPDGPVAPMAPMFTEGYDSVPTGPVAPPLPVGDPLVAATVMGAQPMPTDEFEERSYDSHAGMGMTTTEAATDEQMSQNLTTLMQPRDGALVGPEQWRAAETLGYEHGSVMKRGYGRCEIRVSPTRGLALVSLPDGTIRAFKSVVAASDYTWCRSKGFEGVEAWRAANPGVRDVPSGAGLGFWGLRRQRSSATGGDANSGGNV